MSYLAELYTHQARYDEAEPLYLKTLETQTDLETGSGIFDARFLPRETTGYWSPSTSTGPWR